MRQKRTYEAPLAKRIIALVTAFMLILTAWPPGPATAAPEPTVLPIYVGWEQFKHTGTDANASSDGSRMLNFPPQTYPSNSASTAGGRLRVTPATSSATSGIVVRTNKIKLVDGFSTYFVMNLDDKTSQLPADGLTFIIQDNPTPQIGGVGIGVGYAGIQNSIGVEFDIWTNNGDGYYDPNANHVAIVKNGVNSHAAGIGETKTPSFPLYGSTVHVWVDYQGDGTLTTSYGLTKNRSEAETLTRNVSNFLTNKEVYVGFGASTGSANANHDVLAWYFKETYVEGGLDPDGLYKQGPSAVTIDPLEGNKGISIKVKGNSTSVNLPNEEVDIYVRGNKVLGEFETDADGNLQYLFDESSGFQAGNNTVTVVSKGGGTSASRTFVGTGAPSRNDIVANATDQVVNVRNVPSGVTVTLADKDGNVVGTAANVTGGTVEFNEDDLGDYTLSTDSPIKVTYSRTGEVPGAIQVTPQERSDVLAANDIFANATKDVGEIQNVPTGAIVRVYNATNELIGEAEHTGAAGTLLVPLTIDLADLQLVRLTIQKAGDLESYPTDPDVQAKLETSAVPVGPIANADTETISVHNVPSGARVVVYSPDGEELASEVNRTGSANAVEILMSPTDIRSQDVFLISIHEVNKYESAKVSTVGQNQSEAPDAANVRVNATTDEVVVRDVPADAVIRVYDEDGNLIGEGRNAGSNAANVVVGIADPGLEDGQEVLVTVQEAGEIESGPRELEATLDTSGVPANVIANASKDQVVVKNVPEGAIVKVYAADGETELGSVESERGKAVIPIADLEAGDELIVTVTERNKYESNPVPVTAKNQTSREDGPLDDDNMDEVIASGTDGEVTVPNVPPGSTIIVYDEEGRELGRGTNTGDDPDEVVINPVQVKPGTDILVTIANEGELESEPVLVNVLFEESAVLEEEDVVANSTADTVKVDNVPAGTTVNVYDTNGNLIGKATNMNDGAQTVTVEIESGLADKQEVVVKLAEPRKLESDGLIVKAVSVPSGGLSTDDVVANATDNTVTVRDVPPGGTITVYDGEGNIIGTATNNGSEAQDVEVDIDSEDSEDPLSEGDTVEVSITLPQYGESDVRVEVQAKVESPALNGNNVAADGTNGDVTVSGVPVGATIIVYDEDGNELGRTTNPGPGTNVVIHTDSMKPGSGIRVTLTEAGELESESVDVTPTFEESAAPAAGDIKANASNNTVKVEGVPSGAVVKIYGLDNNGDPIVIGTAVNEGANTGSVTVSIPGGLEPGDKIQATITELHKTESELSEEVDAVYDPSEGLNPADIKANATDNKVMVRNVPANTTVNVYNKIGVLIGTATSGGAGTDDVVIEMIAPYTLVAGETVNVTIKSPGYKESDRVAVTALEQTDTAGGPLDEDNVDDIAADGTEGQLTVPNVPPGATVTVYDEDGNVLGHGKNEGTDADTLVIELDNQNPDQDQVIVTIAESGKLESDEVPITLLPSAALSELEELPMADATNDTVTVEDVPPGATITVYDEDGVQVIGTKTNNGTSPATLTISISEAGLTPGQVVQVTINEPYKSESAQTAVIAGQNDSAVLNSDDIEANATNNEVTVRNVPPGATIKLYDKDGNFIESVTNNGTEAADFDIDLSPDYVLEAGETIQASITLKDAHESEKTNVVAALESDPLTGGVSASSSTSQVTAADVPSGATVYVYDASGNLIGSGINEGGNGANLSISITPKLTTNQPVHVTIRESGKLESQPLEVRAAMDKTVAPAPANLKANSTASRITVSEVPAGATARIYDDTGKLVATRKNTTAAALKFDFQITPALAEGKVFSVSLSETGRLESDRIPVTARAQTAAPSSNDVKDVNVGKDTVTIGNVPPGATVIVYDDKGNEIGRGSNDAGTAQDVTITDAALVTSEISVTFTEPNKHESAPLVIDINLNTNDAIDDALRRLSVAYQEADTWESVTLPVFVVTAGAHGTDVAWSSGKQHVIEITAPTDSTIEALVHRQANDESVILTATVSKNGISKSRTFLLNVMAANLTKTVNPNYRQVNVTGGEDEGVSEQVGIERITMSNGLKIDKAVFDPATAGSFVGDPRTENGVSSINVDELLGDEADEFAIEIPRASVELLEGNGNSLEIRTEYGILRIAANVLGDMNESFLDLFFRLVPLKDADRQEELNRDILNESVVRTAAAGKIAEVIGSSMTIETNYSGYPTTLVIPFAKNGITLPEGNPDSFLESLRVYIEHSDGEKVVRTGTVVYKDGEPFGLSIDINKFSTFSIIQLRDVPYTGIVPEVPATDGKEQVKTSTVDSKEGTIVLELDKTGYGIDKSGFTVTIGGRTVEIEEVVIDGGKVTIKLKDGVPAGYEAIVSYKNTSAVVGALKSFEGLVIANPAHHEAYVNGFPDGTFRPQNTITRAEMAAILARNKGLTDKAAYQGLYPDVAAGFWATAYIEQLKELGLIVGDDEGNFRPSDRITRAEMAMIAARWLGADLSKAGATSFADVPTGHWAASAIAAVSEAGVMIGFEDGSFGINDLLTRAQAVTIMNRLLGRGPLTGVADPTWPDVPSNHWAYEQIEEASRNHDYIYLPDSKEKLYLK